MQKLRLYSLVFFASIFAMIYPNFRAAAQDASEEVEQAIKVTREGLLKAFNAGDLETLLTFVDTDVIITWQNAEVTRGHDAVRTYYNRMLAGPTSVVKTVSADPKVEGRRVVGDLAYSYGTMNDHFELREGGNLDLASRFSAVLSKQSGGWKLSALHLSTNTFDNPLVKLAVTKTACWVGFGALLGGLLIGYVIKRARIR